EQEWKGDIPRSEIERSELEDASQFMRWSEVEALQRGGVVDIQSHTMLHRRVFASSRLVGFVAREWTGPLFNIPQHCEDRRVWTHEALNEAAGSPLFESLPLLGLQRAWMGGEALREVCL